MADLTQVSLFSDPIAAASVLKRASREGTFVDNMSLPVHRWFRFSAGFSTQWVEELLMEHLPPGGAVLDPFAGSGTTLIAADKLGIRSSGFEAHPFVSRVANAKMLWHLSHEEFVAATKKVRTLAQAIAPNVRPSSSPLLSKCYTPGVLRELEALREAWTQLYAAEHEPGVHNLVWLAITAILRETSFVGTANWQYLLPNKRKARTREALPAFEDRVSMMANDMMFAQENRWQPLSRLLTTDARDPVGTAGQEFDLVITSPPYPNNFDYADATRLELTFWGEISKWSDLQGHVRRHLVRACSQHSAAERLELSEVLACPELYPIRSEIGQVCEALAAVRETRAGRKSYHTMVAGYFLDLANVWLALRPLCRRGATVCFVIGDSAPYGVHVPVNEWLGKLALSAGFKSFRFEKMRDRNMKWKNRKHRVPLLEGRLWVEG